MESRKEFKWTVYAVSATALLLVLVAAYLCVRLVDGLWENMTLPMILMISYATVTVITAMFLGLSERKCEACRSCIDGPPAPQPVVEVAPVKTRKPRTPKIIQVGEPN